MALIHRTTLKPTKLELLASWLPTRPWYAGGPDAPELTKAGGFRLDDPEGEVGIEFMVATDTSGPAPVHYLAPSPTGAPRFPTPNTPSSAPWTTASWAGAGPTTAATTRS